MRWLVAVVVSLLLALPASGQVDADADDIVMAMAGADLYVDIEGLVTKYERKDLKTQTQRHRRLAELARIGVLRGMGGALYHDLSIDDRVIADTMAFAFYEELIRAHRERAAAPTP